MPIVKTASPSFELRCVTTHPDQGPLRPIAGLFSLYPAHPPQFGPRLKAYYCDVCGYVELYVDLENKASGGPEKGVEGDKQP